MFGLRSLGIADRQDGKCWEDLTAVVPYVHWLLYQCPLSGGGRALW